MCIIGGRVCNVNDAYKKGVPDSEIVVHSYASLVRCHKIVGPSVTELFL